jgi:chromosome segregation ATPase
MKILRFAAENIKKLKVVEIVPDGSVVQITGPNGSGKSSILDAIYYALAGTKGIPSEPIRHGESNASIKLDLGDVTVTRKFVGENTTLHVEAANGARFPSPQRMLDDLLGALTFDPLEFSRMEPRRQLETLRHLVTLDQDIDALDAQNKTDYDQRTIVNRRVKELQAQVDAIEIDPNLPGERIDVSELSAQIEAAGQHNLARVEQQQELDRLKALAKETDEAIGAQRARIDHLRQELKEAEGRLKTLVDQLVVQKNSVTQFPPIPAPMETAAIRQQIDAAAETNKAIDARDHRKELQRHLKEAEQASQELTKAMDERTALKQATIEQAKMPVAGLGFGEDGVTYQGLPFDQASSAEQLRVSVAIAMAANPKLRVLRIKDGSLLDEKNLALISGMATEQDFQIWIETVGTHGPVGIVMEDGEIKEIKHGK